MRELAADRFDANNAASDAARIASVFINALPQSGQENARTRGELWMAKANEPALANATPEGLAMAKDMYKACQISVEARSSYSMRNCLSCATPISRRSAITDSGRKRLRTSGRPRREP